MERWRPVVGYEGRYEVSDLGRVRNRKGKVLSPYRLGPYMAVKLYAGSDESKDGFSLHRLVARAFIGEPPDPTRTDIDHIDHCPWHNGASNLRWVNASENALNRNPIYGKPFTTPNYRRPVPITKLTWEQAHEIREKYGLTEDRPIFRLIAEEYGVAIPTIMAVFAALTHKSDPLAEPVRAFWLAHRRMPGRGRKPMPSRLSGRPPGRTIGFQLNTETSRKLGEWAAELGRSRSWLVREVLEQALKEREEQDGHVE